MLVIFQNLQFKKGKKLFFFIILVGLVVLLSQLLETKLESKLQFKQISSCFDNNKIYPEELTAHYSYLVNKVSISKDSSIMASSVYDEIKLWKINEQKKLENREIIVLQNPDKNNQNQYSTKQKSEQKYDKDFLGTIENLAIVHDEDKNEAIVASWGFGKQQFTIWRVSINQDNSEFTLLNKSDLIILGEIKSIAISPNHKYVAIGSNRIITVWEINTDSISDKPIFRKDLEEDVTALTFSTDSETLISGSEVGKIHVLDFIKQEGILTTIRDRNTAKTITSLTISPNENIISIFDNGQGILWKNLPHPSPQRRIQLQGIDNKITSVAISPDSNNLVIGRFGGIVELWNLDSLKRLHICQLSNIVNNPNIALSVNNKQEVKIIAYGSQVMNLWRLNYPQ